MAHPLELTVSPPTRVWQAGEQTQKLAVSENRVIGNQVVFRVKNARQQPDTPSQQQGIKSAEPTFHPRRPHRKSRTGCSNCKKRRIKCDETKPGCRKCDAYGISCDYLAVQSRPKPNAEFSFAGKCSKSPEIDNSAFSFALNDLADKIDSALRLAPNIEDDLKTIAPKPVNRVSVEALHHFLVLSSEDNALSDIGKDVTNGAMLRIAFQIPYLMHAILGAASSSHRRLLPWKPSIKIAESYHWQRAITLYQKELSTPIGVHNMDGLMSTYTFLNSRPPIYLKVFGSMSSWNRDPLFEDHRAGAEGLHPGLAELCEIDETTTEETNPYHWPLRMLSPLLALEPTRKNFTKITAFMGRLLPDFTSLLEKKDPRAVLILGYWLAKKCQENHWWMHPRVHAECVAICMFLENSPDLRILKLLEYPAEHCGYLLKHVREQAIFAANIDFLCLF